MIEMGRTVQTFRDMVEREEERWHNFRRTLRPLDRSMLDAIFDSARAHADAGTMIVTPRPIEVVLISALIDLLGTVRHLEERLTELEKRTERCGKENDGDD